MKKTIFILLTLLPFLIACVKREWTNPFSADCPKDMWTPTNFTAVQEGSTVKLTWSQPINNISGFKIQKSIDGASSAAVQDQTKGASQFTDNSLTGGKVHLYSITAFAGNNTSNTVTAQVTPVLTAGITTTSISAVGSVTAQSGGNISSDGGAAITARGICWGTATAPTIAGSKTTDGSGTGSFASSITGLSPGTTYYVRAYAINSAGTSYGNEVTLTTSVVLAAITTTALSAITSNTATSGGNITTAGGAAITARGVCWSTTTAPTSALTTKTTDGSGTGSFTSSITGLTAGTTYYLRAYATNSAGTSYGNEVTLTTNAIIPTVTTTAMSSITSATATSGGNITSDGGASIIARGVCWGTATAPTIAGSKTTEGTGTGSFTSSISGLSPATTYYLRAYAINSVGTAYGNEVTFTTPAIVPTLSTTVISSITVNSAISGGTIVSDGGTAITARGVCWNTAILPTISNYKTTDGTGIGSYTSNITGLTVGTIYYVRAYATNSAGTVYGNEISFTTSSVAAGTVIDADGNVYSTVTIGTQVWTASNLKTTKYNDGTAIPLVTDNTAWANLSTPGYCWYNNDVTTYKNTYGALYNWYTVNTGKLCATGWHVPTDAEWTVLTTYLGGESVAGGKLKETGTSHWLSPNTEATNTTGFTALPGGYRGNDGAFDDVGLGTWWSSTEYSPYAWFRSMGCNNSGVYRSSIYKLYGFSVRCLRDF